MSEQMESEKEESQADKAIKKLVKYKKQDQEYGNTDDLGYVEIEWRSVEAKVKVLGFIDILGSIFGFYEAATLDDPYIAVVAFFGLLLGLYLMS